MSRLDRLVRAEEIDNTTSNTVYGYIRYYVVLAYFKCPKCGEKFLDDKSRVLHRCPACGSYFFSTHPITKEDE